MLPFYPLKYMSFMAFKINNRSFGFLQDRQVLIECRAFS